MYETIRQYVRTCHKCLIENDELNNTRLNGDEIVLRIPENMKDYVNRGIANQYSLHNMKNIFENIHK